MSRRVIAVSGFFGLAVVLVLSGLVAFDVIGWPGGDSGESSGEYRIVLVPHPDDEMQAWSLVESSRDRHHVFAVLTQGEQSSLCSGDGHDPSSGELAPTPPPAGRWSASCAEARVASLVAFMDEMWPTTVGAAATFQPMGSVPMPVADVACRVDDLDPDQPCSSQPRAAEVWVAQGASIVQFDLGDGDLEVAEVESAVRVILDAPAEFGVPDGRVLADVVGASYFFDPDLATADLQAEDGGHSCFEYPHPDHGAVHDFLRDADWIDAPRLTAVCGSATAESVEVSVSRDLWDVAFLEDPDRLGAHIRHYGWLFDAEPGFYRGDYDRQDELFHREQEFWSSRP